MSSNVFIVGVGRSGTSLLQSMLNAHPEIAFLPETHFLRKYIFTNKKWPSKKDVIDILHNDLEFNRVGVPIEDIIDKTSSFKHIYDQLLERYLKLKNKSIIGDKDPRNIDFIKQLHFHFPNARIIHIIRDPRDVVLSRTKASWSSHWPFFMHSMIYKAQLKRGRHLGKEFYGKNYKEIFYEELVQEPIRSLMDISKFIGVPYDSYMLSFSKSAKELVDESEIQWKKETFGPLLSENTKKWIGNFSDFQIALIQDVCSYTFKNLSYEKYPVSLQYSDRIKIFFLKISSEIFSLLYPLRVNFLKK